MLNLKPVVQTMPGAVSFLASKEAAFLPVTLDETYVTADGATGLKKVLAGTIIGLVSGQTNLYRPYTAAVQASKALGVVGNKNAITYTAVPVGTLGNAIEVALIDPAGNSYPLAVTVVNDEVRVQLATSGAGAITSTGADVVAAINASILCKNIMTAALTVGAGNDGTGACAAIAATALAGGVDALGVPAGILAEDCNLSNYDPVAGLTFSDKTSSALYRGRVIEARLPVAPDAAAKAALSQISWT